MSDDDADLFEGINAEDTIEVNDDLINLPIDLGEKVELNPLKPEDEIGKDTIEEDEEKIKKSQEKLKKKKKFEKQLKRKSRKVEKIVFNDKSSLIQKIEQQSEYDTGKKSKKQRKAVWQDSDDEDNLQVGDVVVPTKYTGSLDHLNKEKSYKSYLTKKFETVVSAPKWADLDREVEVDSDEEIFRTAGFIDSSRGTNLPSERLAYKVLKDLNRAMATEGRITGICFHPESTVSLVSGENGVATVYSIDGLKNEKLHSMQFRNFPIKCMKLLSNGKDVIFGGPKKFMYTYDLIETKPNTILLPKSMASFTKFEISPDNKYIVSSGRFGEIHLLSMNSKELIHTFRQEEQCTALTFSNDSKKIIAHSSASNITVLNIGQQRVEHVFIDDGCISGKCLDISPNGQLLATGSNEGVVNIYNYPDTFKSENPTPLKILYNLQTSISDLKFNYSNEILGYCSRELDNAVKMVHFPTATVFSNFPPPSASFGKVRKIAFSPSSGYFAMGNFGGKVPFMRLKHYNNY